MQDENKYLVYFWNANLDLKAYIREILEINEATIKARTKY